MLNLDLGSTTNDPVVDPSRSSKNSNPIVNPPDEKRRNLYGHILGDVKEILPNFSSPEFIFGDEAQVPLHSLPTLPPSLMPTPFTTEPPAGFSYPASPDWKLSKDSQYRCGRSYTTSVSTEWTVLRDETYAQLSLTTHPTVDPVFDIATQTYIDRDPEGMVKLIAGIPFRLNLEDGASTTYACYHTLESVSSMYPDKYQELLNLTNSLYLDVFGRPPSSDGSMGEIRPIFALPFFQQNLRSENKGQQTRVEAGISDNFNGSYSIASTIWQLGQGILVPAQQIAYDGARKRIGKLLTTLKDIYQILGPLSMSRLEWEITQFHLDDNNIFSFGGLEHGGISVQFNVSSGFNGGDLVKELSLQGTWHLDEGDAFTLRTLFILLLKLPPGKVT